jgi:tetratricopeptide (TPR) repeat protein
MAAKKVSRKKLLKEPDEFISTTSKVIQFFRTRQRQIVWFAAVFLVVALAGGGVFYYFRWQEEKALVLQDEALQIYQGANRSGQENPGKEKKEEEELKKALDKFRRARSLYGWGRTGQVSELYIGHCLFALKEYDRAQAAYSRCLEGPFRSIALNGLAYSFEAKGDYAQALENFQKDLNEPDNPFQLESMLGAARCYEVLKDKPKALEMYQKALARFPKSSMAEFIRWKVSELKG